jgi:hypothetical protein
LRLDRRGPKDNRRASLAIASFSTKRFAKGLPHTSISTNDSFASCSRLLINLVGRVSVAFECCAIRLTAQISYFVARFAGPSVRFVKPTKNYLVAAGERKQHLIEHGDSHGDSPQTDDRQNLGGGLDRLPVLDLASFHSCAYQVT